MALPESQYQNLCLAHLNICGLRHKIPDIHNILTCRQIHVLALTETKLNNKVKDFQLNIPNYRLYRKDRNRKKYGVALYIQNHIPVKQRSDLEEENLEMIWVELYRKTKRVLVGCCYRPPGTGREKEEYLNQICRKIETVTKEGKDVFLLGDFNIDWLANEKMKETIHSVSQRRGLTQIINIPTRMEMAGTKFTSTCIDHIYTNVSELCSPPASTVTGCTDHNLVSVTVAIRVPKMMINQRSYGEFDRMEFITAVKEANWEDVTRESDPEKALSKFTQIFKEISDTHAPLTRETTTNCCESWWGEDFKIAISKRDAEKQQAIKSKKKEDWDKYNTSRNSLFWIIRKKTIEHFKETRIYERHENLMRENSEHVLIHPEPNHGQLQIATEINDIIVFNQYYTDKDQRWKCHCSFTLTSLSGHTEPTGEHNSKKLKFKKVKKTKVRTLLSSLPQSLIPGTDEIDAKLLHYAAEYISDPIHHILNTCIIKGVFPSQWKEYKIIPDSRNCDFRPKSLPPSLSLILEKILLQQIEEHFRQNNQKVHHQHVPIDQSWFTEQHDSESSDVSSPVKTITRDQLNTKLKSYSFSDLSCAMISSFLFERKNKVFYHCPETDWQLFDCKLAQGSCLTSFISSIT